MALEKGPVKLRTCKTGYSSAECRAQVIGGYSGDTGSVNHFPFGDAKNRMPVACLKTSFQFRTTDPKRTSEGLGQAFRWALLDSTNAEYGSNPLDMRSISQLGNSGTTSRLANSFHLSEPRVQAPLHLVSLDPAACQYPDRFTSRNPAALESDGIQRTLCQAVAQRGVAGVPVE